jgi:predicted DNA-binding transcriptional regulator YafY
MAGPSSRMLELLSLLQVRRDWPGGLLADRLSVSARTVRRDVDRLRELGYRIDALRGPDGGYRLAAGTELPPLLFDDDQAVAVALALAVAPASGADIAEAAARALATVRQVMPSRLRHRVDAVDVVASPGGPVVDPDVLVAVSEATRAREVLRFDYDGPGRADGTAPRRVEPHAVVARGGRWYLLAWDDEAAAGEGDWRTYRIDRMRLRAPTRRAFAPRAIPGDDPGAFVTARFRGADDGAWPCVGTAVVALPAARIAPFVDADALLEEAGSSTRITIGSWSWRALAARFAGLDAPFEIVGPDDLRRAAEELAGRLRSAADSALSTTDRPE